MVTMQFGKNEAREVSRRWLSAEQRAIVVYRVNGIGYQTYAWGMSDGEVRAAIVEDYAGRARHAKHSYREQ